MRDDSRSRDGAALVRVPAGAFVMGTAPEGARRLWESYGWDPRWLRHAEEMGELRPHEVEVGGFWLYRTYDESAGPAREATVAEDGVFLNALISFVLVAIAVFMLVKAINRLRRVEPPPPRVREHEHRPPMPEQNADVFEVLIGQMGEY